MKNTPTVSRLLRRLEEALIKIDRLDSILKHRASVAFSVTFIHSQDLTLKKVKWSDSYDASENPKDAHYEYTYEVTSRGIHFTGFSEKKVGGNWWETSRCWYSSGDESSMRMIDVPNLPPPTFKGTMYIFHQEKIRETLAALPAWATVVGTY